MTGQTDDALVLMERAVALRDPLELALAGFLSAYKGRTFDKQRRVIKHYVDSTWTGVCRTTCRRCRPGARTSSCSSAGARPSRGRSPTFASTSSAWTFALPEL